MTTARGAGKESADSFSHASAGRRGESALRRLRVSVYTPRPTLHAEGTDPMTSLLPVAPAPILAAPPRRRPRARAAVPSLSVVLVNYHQWRLTAGVIAQLRRSHSFRKGGSEVVVVDNHSPPHQLLPRLRRLEGVSLRRWGRNRGFAFAVNEGVRLGRGDWLLLLNPDVS